MVVVMVVVVVVVVVVTLLFISSMVVSVFESIAFQISGTATMKIKTEIICSAINSI